MIPLQSAELPILIDQRAKWHVDMALTPYSTDTRPQASSLSNPWSGGRQPDTQNLVVRAIPPDLWC